MEWLLWVASVNHDKQEHKSPDVLHPDWSLRWALLSVNYLLLQGRSNKLLLIGEEPFPSVKRTGLCEIKISLTSISHSLFPVASSRPSVTGYSLGTLTIFSRWHPLTGHLVYYIVIGCIQMLDWYIGVHTWYQQWHRPWYQKPYDCQTRLIMFKSGYQSNTGARNNWSKQLMKPCHNKHIYTYVCMCDHCP